MQGMARHMIGFLRGCRPAVVVAGLCALLLSCPASLAQVPDPARLYAPAPRPPGIRYLVLESEHFQVIFQEGAESVAREAAALLEGELPGAEALVGHRSAMRMPVVLNAYNDRSNGYVNTLPFRQEIEAPGIKGQRLSARYTSWMQAVVPHELVHAVQANSHAGFGVGALLRRISPDLAHSLNLGLPPGLSEGAAVYYESSVQEGAGRLNFSLFQMQFRAAMASPRPWSVAQLLEVPAYSRPRNRYYSGGANFFAYLSKDDSGRFFRDVKALHYRLPLLGTGFELWHGTGLWPRRLGTAFRRDVRAEEAERRRGIGPLVQGRLAATGPGRSHRRPQWVNDSTVVVHVSGYDVRSGFYLIGARTGAMQPVGYEYVTEDAGFSVAEGGAALLFSRYVQDRHVPTRWVADVFRLDLSTGATTRVTRDQRVFFPVRVRDRMWAIQNQGQFTRWVRIGAEGRLQQVSAPMRTTFVQVAPSPDGTEAAVVLRRGGRQGIYRATWAAGDGPALEPWIVFRDASVYDVFWQGRHLLFTADPRGVANVFAVVGDRIVQLTNVPYGAMEPSVSPDGTALAYVEYAHERYDLRVMPFDVGNGRPLPASELLDAVPAAMPVDLMAGGTVVPYRSARHLRPRTLLPDFLDSGNGTAWGGALGFGPGLTLQGADPLRRWTYSVAAYRQAERMWYGLGVATQRGGIRADLEAFSEPGTAVVRYGTRAATTETVGQEHVGARLNLSLPVFLESNVHSTTAWVALESTVAANRLFALPGRALPPVPNEWRRFRGRFTLGPAIYLRYRMSRNMRDLMPSRGTSLSASADWDVWSGRGGERRGMTARLAHYLSLSRRRHTGLRLRATMVAQSRPWVYNMEYFAPRGYEHESFDARSYFGLDGLVMQPLWFIDNGFVLMPVYFKVLYLYGFAEALCGIRDDACYRAAGAGLGVQLRLLHYLDMEIRLGVSSLLESGQLRWTLR